MKLEADIRKKAEYWANSPVFDDATRREVASLLERGHETELVERFYRDLEFGTAGLRGIVGAGTARMNAYNVRKAAYALAEYLKEASSEKPNEKPTEKTRVALTYDSRKHSLVFIQAAAEVLAACGIEVWITEKLQPVPILSYLIREKKCAAGIAVTASHNPPEYNGCKIYWKTGGQIIPPQDQGILKHYNRIEEYGDIPRLDFDTALKEGKIRKIGADLENRYLETLKTLKLSTKVPVDFKVVFTPLHGTTGEIIPRALKAFGIANVSVVEAQRKPDGAFPTVKFPNPEEKDALKMALDQARAEKADVVLATDPDGDRIGVIVREKDDYRYLEGNEIACLLTEYVLAQRVATGTLSQKPLVVKSITTSPLMNRIAEFYGAHVDETLTGFKWICQVIEDYETGVRKPKRDFICGGEESFGFLVGSFVRDKDGVGAACVAAEMVAHYKACGVSISQVLESIYRRDGVYLDEISTLTLPGKEGAERIIAMTAKLRHQPPKQIAGFEVVRIRDYESSKELSWADNELTVTGQLQMPKSNVLQFYLDEGTRISVRPSGTEPKIKFYYSIRQPCESDATDADVQLAKSLAREKLEQIKNAVTHMG
jgi:phosphoglucomutase